MSSLSNSEKWYTDFDIQNIEEQISRKGYEDHFCMLVVNLDVLEMRVIKDSPFFSLGSVGQSFPYVESVRKFASSFEGETRDFFLHMSDVEYVIQQFSDADKYSYSYKSTNIGSGKWVNVTGYVLSRNSEGTVSTFSLGFSLLDTMGADRQELQSKLAEATRYNRFLDAIVQRYATLYVA